MKKKYLLFIGLVAPVAVIGTAQAELGARDQRAPQVKPNPNINRILSLMKTKQFPSGPRSVLDINGQTLDVGSQVGQLERNEKGICVANSPISVGVPRPSSGLVTVVKTRIDKTSCAAMVASIETITTEEHLARQGRVETPRRENDSSAPVSPR